MRIAVCVTQVLDPERVAELAGSGFLRIDPAGGRPDAAHIAPVMNEADRQALSKAVAVAATLQPAAEVVALSVGAMRPDELLSEAFQMGAAAALHVDADTAGADVATVAALLAAGVEHAGGADLVLAGAQASGGDSGAAGAALAAALDLPCFTGVRSLAIDGGGAVRVTRADAGGEQELELHGPALLCVYDEAWKPPVLNPRHLIAARDKVPQRLDAAVLGLGDAQLRAARRVEVLDVEVPDAPSRCVMLDTGDVAAAVRELVDRLQAEGVV